MSVGYPAYFWRYKRPYVAWFCNAADAESFLMVGEELENLAAIGPEPQERVEYENVGHFHCMAEGCEL